MTLGTALQVFRNRLGQRTSLDVELRVELARAQEFYEGGSEVPWFLHKRANVSSSANPLPLPQDFLVEQQFIPLISVWVDNRVEGLVKRGLWEIERNLEPGKPSFYVLEPGQILLSPPPNQVYDFELNYAARDTAIGDLADNQTNLWLTYAPEVLINHAGVGVASALRSMETAQLFASALGQSLRSMWQRHYAEFNAGRGLTLGG